VHILIRGVVGPTFQQSRRVERVERVERMAHSSRPPPKRATCVVFDIETDTAFCNSNTTRDEQMTTMQATVVCSVTFTLDDLCNKTGIPDTATRLVCWRDDNESKGGPFEPLFREFDSADIIVAFNGLGFDMPVLKKYYGRLNSDRFMRHCMATHDPFARIRSATGMWPSLNKLLEQNGFHPKTSNGLEAIRMWERGERERLQQYCVDDVNLLADLVLCRSPVHCNGVVLHPSLISVHANVFGAVRVPPVAPAVATMEVLEVEVVEVVEKDTRVSKRVR
jgi:hypothetical protein